MTRSARIHLFVAALSLTLLNAIKPVTMDDPSYLLHARHVAQNPLNPYGGEMFTYQAYGPALYNNAPPVSIYWLGAGMRLLGNHVVLLKLWLLLWALLLAFALHALLVRVAPGVAVPFTWTVMLSPWVLPGFNFMIDVPALAMSLGAIALFARAADRDSVRGAVLAGIVAGLAIQTKYTGAIAPAVILAYGLVTRRVRLALAACVAAGLLALGWEALMGLRYGDTPVLHYLGRRERGESGVPRLDLVVPLFRFVGVLAAGLVPLGLAAVGASRRATVLAMTVVAAGYAAFALLPEHVVAALDGISGGRFIDFDNATLGPAALAIFAIAGVVLWRSGRRHEPLDRFLLLWLSLELAGYFLISTAPAARRVMGVLVVASLLLARCAARRAAGAPARMALLGAAAAFAVVFGLGFWAVDVDDARAQRDDVQRVLRTIERARGAGSGAADQVWYVGNHFGAFQYYAPRSGMRPVMTGRSTLHAGDWLVIPLFVDDPDVRLDRSILRPVATLRSRGIFRLPVTTRGGYYFGGRPLLRPDPDWRVATIYRVTGDGVAVLEKARSR